MIKYKGISINIFVLLALLVIGLLFFFSINNTKESKSYKDREELQKLNNEYKKQIDSITYIVKIREKTLTEITSRIETKIDILQKNYDLSNVEERKFREKLLKLNTLQDENKHILITDDADELYEFLTNYRYEPYSSKSKN